MMTDCNNDSSVINCLFLHGCINVRGLNKMISGIDIADYKEDHPSKLYELADQRGKDKMVKIDGIIFKFGWLDGMYCNVYDLEGHQYTIAAYTDCVPLTKDHQEGV